MMITLIGIGMAVVVLGLAAAVLLCTRPTTPQQHAEQAPDIERAVRPGWSAEHMRMFADTVPNIRLSVIAEKAAGAIADIPLPEVPEVPQPQGDPEQ